MQNHEIARVAPRSRCGFGLIWSKWHQLPAGHKGRDRSRRIAALVLMRFKVAVDGPLLSESKALLIPNENWYLWEAVCSAMFYAGLPTTWRAVWRVAGGCGSFCHIGRIQNRLLSAEIPALNHL